MTSIKWRILLCICTAAAWGALQVACDDSRDFGDEDDDGSDSDSDGDSDSDSDGDSDGDTDTGPCEPPVWGSGLSLGNPVANWQVAAGYMDADFDGVIEQEEVAYSLEDIHCMGVQSIVVVVGDTS